MSQLTKQANQGPVKNRNQQLEADIQLILVQLSLIHLRPKGINQQQLKPALSKLSLNYEHTFFNFYQLQNTIFLTTYKQLKPPHFIIYTQTAQPESEINLPPSLQHPQFWIQYDFQTFYQTTEFLVFVVPLIFRFWAFFIKLMCSIIKSQFAQLLEQFSDPVKAKRLHKKAQNSYLMRSFKVTNVSSEQAIQSYDRLQAKYESGELKIDANDWHKNQRKLFIWYLICYCQERKTSIQDLTNKDWELMGSIFFDKSPLFLKFQGLSILKNTKRHNWTDQDDDQLKKFVAQINSNQWNSISKSIFFESDKGKFISAKQCRQRWFNHISKEVNKDQWTHEEDIRILKLTLEIGKKWSQIARLLGTHRTEHMVKNRFNSIINKIRKKKMENEESLTKKALNMLEKQEDDNSEKEEESMSNKQREMQIQRPSEKQKMVIQIIPKTEQKEEGMKKGFLKRFPSKDSEAEFYNLSELAEGDLNLKDLKNFISKKEKGCFSFNPDESLQAQNPEHLFFNMTPNSMKAISPGISNPFYMSFESFTGRKQDGQIFSPAQQSYSPAGFFSSLSPAPGLDMFSFLQRDKSGLNSSKQYFSSSSIFTPVPNDLSFETKTSTNSKKQRKQMQQ